MEVGMDNIKFGRFIRESRQAKGMTQKQLAEKIHVSDKAVSKWENGAGFPDIKILEPLAACLGVSLLELMQGEKMGKWDERFVVPPDVIVPFHAVRASYAEEGIPFFASSASFVLSDALCMNAFKQEMKDLGFRSMKVKSVKMIIAGATASDHFIFKQKIEKLTIIPACSNSLKIPGL